MDILDSIDGLTDEDDEMNEDSLDSLDSLDDAIGDIDELVATESTMSENEAREITEAIRSAATATYILLAQAHEGKAYRALGYDTWASYVTEEFEISAARSYQLLNLSKAIAMIEEAAPEGTSVKLTEAQARDIKRELPKITEQIREETKDLSSDEAADAIDRIVEHNREQQKLDEKALAEQDEKMANAEQEGYQAGLERAADALLESDMPDTMSSSADDEFVEVEVAGDGTTSPSDSLHLYNFINYLVGMSALPSPDDFVEVIPVQRAQDILDQTNDAISYLNRLSTLLEMKE